MIESFTIHDGLMMGLTLVLPFYEHKQKEAHP
jgi:hypothetical protein